jgi:hypothetical protein
MKKHVTEGMAVITAVMFCLVVLAPAVFAGDLSHTITIVNNSNTPIKSAGKSFQKANYGALATCGIEANCPSEKSLTVNNATIPANGTGTVTMTGPEGCRVMGFMSYWTPDVKNSGQIQCGKSWTAQCNSATSNLTCTIDQTNVDTVKGKNGTATAASSVQ